MEPTTVLSVNVRLACQAILKLHVFSWAVDPIQNALPIKLASTVSV
jgi:hypothetical protein